MAERVLITTTDLEPSVRLRDAFARAGYPVELLTPTEKVADVEDAALLVLTGALDQKRARRLAREAAELDLPIIGLLDAGGGPAVELRRRLRLAETFSKPIDADEVALVGHRLIERRRLQQMTGILGESEAIQDVLERILQFAPVSSTVLITGESGTGKELVARGIHALSPRKHRPFIAANVAALSETLLESELFGHEKGAFTGAVGQRKGFFELADRGTLFLDEIGEMPPATQTKLLRVLEQHEFMRVGGEQPIRVDTRVIAATNRDLRQLVELGEFRRDLFFRLNVLHIRLPPLRARREDIPLLVDAFIRATSEQHDLAPVQLAPEALELLVGYDWPGNIRELRNLVESMVVMTPGRTITADDIPSSIRERRVSRPLPVHVPRVTDSDADTPPAIEFLFRMMLELRMDVDELRREFERYRREHPELPGPFPLPYPYPYLEAGTEVQVAEERPPADGEAREAEEEALDEDRTVVFRPGMTMKDVEREAIVTALKEVGGNRREAAEMLGIGERTLYRKIKEYEIPL